MVAVSCRIISCKYLISLVKNNAKIAANWVMGELSGSLNKNELTIDKSPISAERLAGLIVRILDDTISGKIAKEVFGHLWSLTKC